MHEHERAPDRLKSYATAVSFVIYKVLHGKRLEPSQTGWRLAHDIASRLALINTYLSSLPPYWIDSNIERLCSVILHDSRVIITPCKRPRGSGALPGLPSLTSSFDWGNEMNPEHCALQFFQLNTGYAHNLRKSCDELIRKLVLNTNDAEQLPESALERLDTPDILIDMGNEVYQAVKKAIECNPALHRCTDNASESRHTARLCLHKLDPAQKSTSKNSGMVISAIDMANWQEFCFFHDDAPLKKTHPPLERGGLCELLNEDWSALFFLSFRSNHGLTLCDESQVERQTFQGGPGESLASVLQEYELTPKDKVVLSYAIARSYWQYYDSELMLTKWTSNTIWFMPEREGEKRERMLPLCAYLSLPLEIDGIIPPDMSSEARLVHKYPRMFEIGALLLEIGLGRTLPTGKCNNMVAQANLQLKIATNALLELEESDWGSFKQSKKYFDQAVRFCFDSKNFTPSEQSKRAGQDVSMRKKTFRQNVVQPLAWLAKKGFKAQAGEITYVKRKPALNEQIIPPMSFRRVQSDALFHSAIIPQKWLADLQKISAQVELKRREHRITTPVRVAILDTGLNMNFPTFQEKPSLLSTVVGWVDLTSHGAGSAGLVDTFGHGTFMARLLMECAPNAEVLVARVAENTRRLKNSADKISEAILWAEKNKADIISMSFGLPHIDQGISDAIESAQRKRKGDIIFLASVGNSSADYESFPARHSSVISVYATDCHGKFSSKNSESMNNAPILGTFGDDIPDSFLKEFSGPYPKICEPGSSVATAVMAGISATMLAYASVMPSLVALQGKAASPVGHVMQRMRTSQGMEALLHRLAQENQDHPRLKAVKPMRFWKNRPNDIARFCAIYDTLCEIDRKFPRSPEKS